MERKMIDTTFFEKWLDKKAELISSKVDREQITTEEMIVLSLQHMDINFRLEFKRIDQQLESMRSEFKDSFHRHDLNFEKNDKILEKIDKRFDRLEKLGMWAFGILFSGLAAIFFELMKR